MISNRIIVSIPKYNYPYKFLSHNFNEYINSQVIVSVLKYKYKYNGT